MVDSVEKRARVLRANYSELMLQFLDGRREFEGRMPADPRVASGARGSWLVWGGEWGPGEGDR